MYKSEHQRNKRPTVSLLDYWSQTKWSEVTPLRVQVHNKKDKTTCHYLRTRGWRTPTSCLDSASVHLTVLFFFCFVCLFFPNTHFSLEPNVTLRDELQHRMPGCRLFVQHIHRLTSNQESNHFDRVNIMSSAMTPQLRCSLQQFVTVNTITITMRQLCNTVRNTM